MMQELSRAPKDFFLLLKVVNYLWGGFFRFFLFGFFLGSAFCFSQLVLKRFGLA